MVICRFLVAVTVRSFCMDRLSCVIVVNQLFSIIKVVNMISFIYYLK